MTFLGLKMIIFGHFSRFLASFKISFTSLQHPKYDKVNTLCYRRTVTRRNSYCPAVGTAGTECTAGTPGRLGRQTDGIQSSKFAGKVDENSSNVSGMTYFWVGNGREKIGKEKDRK